MDKPKILLVLTRTLGDVILIHNLVDGCFKKYGDCLVDVIVESKYIDLISGNPRIHEIISGDNWHNRWEDILQYIIKNDYDDYLIPQQLNKEDNVWHQLEEHRHQHLVDFYLKRCRLPARTQEDKLQIYIGVDDLVFIEKALANTHMKDYVLIHTTSLGESKDWDYFNELNNKIIEHGVSVIQIGSKTDKKTNSAFDFTGDLTFKQIAALCKNAKCFIGLDSGLSYLACASGCKTIVIQGATIPTTSGPWGDNVINIVGNTLLKCEKIRCHAKCRYPEEGKCINNVTVDQVYSSIF